MEAFEEKLCHRFGDRRLLETALTHSSYANESRAAGCESNERLEFLGDAVLELCVSERLYAAAPALDEGTMTRRRARLVCEGALFLAAQRIGIAQALRLGHGEERSGGRDKPSVVSDALEALIGAIYLDGGLDSARAFVDAHIMCVLMQQAGGEDRDFKTRLQEYVQKRHIGRLRYELVGATGPDHNRAFTMRVLLSEREIGRGRGSTKQGAGQQAAERALRALERAAEEGAPCG